jgi:hypothetical protein
VHLEALISRIRKHLKKSTLWFIMQTKVAHGPLDLIMIAGNIGASNFSHVVTLGIFDSQRVKAFTHGHSID